jgi:hypothetical protein
MKKLLGGGAAVVVVVALFGLFISLGSRAATKTGSTFSDAGQKETVVTKLASSTFEVKLSPQEDMAGDPTIGRMSIDKQFRGGLEAASRGQMLATRTPTEGSAGYVAIERVTGTLDGLKGSFSLQHSGTMARGAQQLSINVIPDSGTGQLAGLAGKMTINIADGKHSYEFEYTLAQPH